MKKINTTKISRRNFIEFGIAGLGTMILPFHFTNSMAQTLGAEAEPHFFLQILIPGGADTSYMFDARPLEFTKAGKMQNYTGVEPTLWDGSNGTSTWASSTTLPLLPFKNDFSIINGVMMSNVDGHDQNMNFLLTGNSFGGESFLPHLNSVGTLPLDGIQSGNVNSTITNLSSTVPLSKDSGSKLIGNLKNGQSLDLEDPAMKFVTERLRANADPTGGRFSEGSQNMLDALKKSPGLAGLLRQVDLPTSTDNLVGFLQLAGGFFKNGISKSAIISFNEEFSNFDTHDPEHAKLQPAQFKKLVDHIVAIFTFLKSNQYDDKRSFFDVTTVLISSEFTRTMRQNGKAIDQTGSDHNQLTNSLIIAGHGIKGGQVVGSSDWQTVDALLSLTHKQFDRGSAKLMGRPFDFANMKSRNDLPDSYFAKDYLGVGSVINTIYSMFGVPAKLHRLVEKNGAVAPQLSGLLM